MNEEASLSFGLLCHLYHSHELMNTELIPSPLSQLVHCVVACLVLHKAHEDVVLIIDGKVYPVGSGHLLNVQVVPEGKPLLEGHFILKGARSFVAGPSGIHPEVGVVWGVNVCGLVTHWQDLFDYKGRLCLRTLNTALKQSKV